MTGIITPMVNKFIFLLLISAPAFADYQADVIRVIDGDTVKLSVEIWPRLTQEINLRLDGVNTPEKRGASDCEKEAGKKATEFTEWFLEGQKVTVSDVKLGKYAGRVLGKISVGGVDLGQTLIDTGHARPYDGGHRAEWCE